jgi:Ca2+-binding RTX toxin-like protein
LRHSNREAGIKGQAQIRPSSSILCAAIVLLIAGLIAPAAEAKPKCKGQKATKVGTDGDDVIRGTGGRDVIVAKGGNDQIFSGENQDLVCAGDGDDFVDSGGGTDKVQGGSGNDTIDGARGKDILLAGEGDDIILGGGGGELAKGGAGNDHLYGEQQDDDLLGGDGDDTLIGSQGSDDLAGDAGNDWLRGDTQSDSYNGGDGLDWISNATATPPEGEGIDERGVTVKLAENFVDGEDANEKIEAVENVLGSPFQDTLYGNFPLIGSRVVGLANRLDDCQGFQTIECGTDPRAGTEAIAFVEPSIQDPGLILLGSTGPDQWTVTIAGADVTITSPTPLAAGPGCTAPVSTTIRCSLPGPLDYLTAYGDSGDDVISVPSAPPLGATIMIDGGRGNDRLEGSPSDDILTAGGPGAEIRPLATDHDVLIGGEGDDALFSRPGGDILDAGPGSDQLALDDPCGHLIDGGPGRSDIAGFEPGEPWNQKQSHAPGFILKIGGSTDYRERTCEEKGKITLANEILEGSQMHDILIGSNRSDGLIIGSTGNDIIKGRGGNDGIREEDGRGIILGGGGFDRIDARDTTRATKDRRIDCGPGGGRAQVDRIDPKPVRCR